MSLLKAGGAAAQKEAVDIQELQQKVENMREELNTALAEASRLSEEKELEEEKDELDDKLVLALRKAERLQIRKEQAETKTIIYPNNKTILSQVVGP